METACHLRRLNQLTPEPVRTGRFTNPGFWSPDSRSFVFTDGTNLKKMRVPDGAPETVTNDVAALVGGSWSDNGTLLVANDCQVCTQFRRPAESPNEST